MRIGERGGLSQIERGEPHALPKHMPVRIDQPRQHGPAASVDAFRIRRVRQHLRSLAGKQHLAVGLDGNGVKTHQVARAVECVAVDVGEDGFGGLGITYM